jgi:hypothetical protein
LTANRWGESLENAGAQRPGQIAEPWTGQRRGNKTTALPAWRDWTAMNKSPMK